MNQRENLLMNKMRVLLVGATAAGAFAAASFVPVHAESQDVGGLGTIEYSTGDGDPMAAYLVLQGNESTQPGYIGVSGPDGGVVGCFVGTFAPGEANVIIPPAGAPDPADPCAPAVPGVPGVPGAPELPGLPTP